MTSLSGTSARAGKAVGPLFYAEMALSPVLAAIALLVPVATDWGAFRYVPAILWLAIFVQCLVTFRWRGLWFLMGPPVGFAAIEAVLVAAPPVPGRVAQAAVVAPGAASATKPDGKDAPDAGSETEPPLIVRNPDGTLTVQKQPPKSDSDGGEEKGLRIPPQVIAPLNPAPEKK